MIALTQLGQTIRSGETGIFRVQSEKIVRQFSIHQGQITFAVSNAKSELPGSFFHKEGLFDEIQLNAYLNAIKVPKTNLWEATANIKSIDAQALAKLRHAYILLLLQTFMNQDAANCSFTKVEHEQTTPWAHTVRLFFDFCKTFTPETTRNICPDFLPTSAIQVNEKLEKQLGALPLSPEEKGLLTVAKNNRTIAEVFSSSFLGEQKISAGILALWLSGLVNIDSAEKAARDQFEQSLSKDSRDKLEQIKKAFALMSSQNYYEWLGVARESTSDIIEKAVKDLLFKLNSSDAESLFFGVEKSLLIDYRSKISEAHKVLTNATHRAEYNGFIGSGGTGSFLSKSEVGKEEEVLNQTAELIHSKMYKEAVALLQKAHGEFPRSALIAAAFAKTILAAHGPKDPSTRDQALGSIKTAMETSPQSPDLFEALGIWMLALGQKEKALEAFKRSVSFAPHQKEAITKIKELSPNDANSIIVLAAAKNIQRIPFYPLLGISEKATAKDIQTAYRDCTKRFHPDRFFKVEDPLVRQAANTIYKKMVKAYTILKNPARKEQYDIQLKKAQATSTTRTISESVSETIAKEVPQDVLPKTQQGKKFYDLALASLRDGKIDAAKLNLKLGLQVEPSSEALKKKLQEINK